MHARLLHLLVMFAHPRDFLVDRLTGVKTISGTLGSDGTIITH